MAVLGYGRLSDLRGCYHCDLHGYDAAWSPEVWTKCLTDRRNRVLVVRDGGRIVGWVSGTVGKGYTDIHRLAVLPLYRRKGLCKRLVEGLGAGELRVVLRLSNQGALAAAKRLGFRAVGVLRSYFDGDDGVALVRRELCTTTSNV